MKVVQGFLTSVRFQIPIGILLGYLSLIFENTSQTKFRMTFPIYLNKDSITDRKIEGFLLIQTIFLPLMWSL